MQQSSLLLKQFEVGPMENFVYLIGDAQTREVLVVDPAWEIDTIFRKADEDNLKIKGALISHHHHDHTNGIEELLERENIPVYVNKNDLAKIQIPSSHLTAVDHAQKIKVGNIEIECLHTPGHTQGSQCFRVKDSLVSGDTLFINGCGRCDFQDSDPEQMYYSLTQKLMRLPGDTTLYPGHHYAAASSATFEEQKRTNPYLKMAAYSMKDFLSLRMGKGRQ
ncbi:MAG: MBL fold metallo-hydrolase [Deltaproteobacteria bacterium]|nr:MBL fold metallo-hydrolase [Deltaproteobacteria bacterium]